MSKNQKLKGLSLNKKTITKLNDSQMKQVNGGQADMEMAPTWSCSNQLCGLVSVGKWCGNLTL